MLVGKPNKGNASIRVQRYSDVRPQIAGLFKERRFQEGLDVLNRLREQLGFNAELLNDIATAQWQLGEQKTAFETMRSIATTLKTNPLAWRKLASMSLSFGDRDAVQKYAKRCLKNDPSDVKAISMLDRIRPFPKGAKEIVALRKGIQSGTMDRKEHASAFNLLAKIEERSGDLDQAMKFFERSKLYSEDEYDAGHYTAFVARQKAVFVKSSQNNSQPDGPRIVFVVGMPRSGTTLLESILVCHEMVHTLGESNVLQSCLNAYLGSKQLKDPWDWVDAISEDDIKQIRKDYLARFNLASEVANSKMLLDKTPMNLFFVGFASIIFPRAKFVYMSRNPLDVGLSNIKTNFSAPLPFSRDWDSLAAVIHASLESALAYEKELASSFRWQSFEELVTSHVSTTKALLKFLELEWDENCLYPERRSAAVTTASIEQVREKINTKGLGKWKRYEAQMQPFVSALGGLSWLEEWSAIDRSHQVSCEPD